MAIVQDTANTYGSGASAALSFVSPTTAGNAIVVAVSTYNGAAGGMHASAVTDNNGNTYTRIEARGPVGVNATALFLALNIAGRSGHQITCAPSDDASQFFTLAIAELDEIPTSAAVDVSVNAAGSSAAPTANLVTTVADTILIGVISHDANTASNRTYTIGSGYTELYNHGNGGVAPPLFFQTKQVASATTHAFDASLNSTAPWMIAAMALVVDTGGSGPVDVAPAASTAVAASVAPTVVLGSLSLAPSAVTAVAASVAPTVDNGVTLAPTATTAVAASVAPTVVLGSVTVAPAAATAVAAAVNPTVSGTTGILARDTFTATTGTLVTDRQSDSGHDWVMQTNSFDTTAFIITSNRARSQVGGTNVGLLDYTPPDDYEVLAQVYRHDESEWAIWGRASATDGDGYSLFWNGTRFDLYRYVNDSGTLLGNSTEHASGLSLSDDTLYWVKIRYEIVSTNVVITAWIRTDAAGEDTYTLMLDVTDSDGARHQAAGLAGLNMRNTGATGGMHTDDFRVQLPMTPDALEPVTVTPGATTAVAASVAPTVVLGSLSLSPGVATAVAASAAPTVEIGALVVAPTASTAVAASVAPTVILGALAVTPGAATAVAASVAPTLVFGSTTAAPSAATAVAATSDPTVTVAVPQAPISRVLARAALLPAGAARGIIMSSGGARPR